MTADNQETILELRDVKKYFPIRSGFFQRKVGDVKAVDGVSFSLKKEKHLESLESRAAENRLPAGR